MKTLFLLRHAKSSWANPGQDDHERPLNDRGRQAAATMGRHIKGLPSRPTLILASTAQRVGETLELLLKAWGEDVPVTRDQNLYLASPKSLLTCLHDAPGKSDIILIVGHNPGIHDFALQLSGEVADDAGYEARQRLKDAYPTAALTVIRFPDARAWRDIAWGSGTLVSFTKPRDLAD